MLFALEEVWPGAWRAQTAGVGAHLNCNATHIIASPRGPCARWR